MTRLFLDTEFAEDGRTIDLISIAVVSQDGKEFYRQNADAELRKANPWVQEHVIPKLDLCPSGMRHVDHKFGLCSRKDQCPWRPKRLIARELHEFVGLISKPDGFTWETPEFWGYYADYDWVALCQLYGKMVDLPTGWPMYCRDLKQWADELQVDLSALSQNNEHHALDDARWNLEAWKYLYVYQGGYLDAERQESRTVDQEPGHVRGDPSGSPRVGKGGRRQDLQRRSGKGRQEGSSQVRQEGSPVGGAHGQE